MMAHAVAVTRQRQKDPGYTIETWGGIDMGRHRRAMAHRMTLGRAHAISVIWWNKSKISIAWRVEPRPGRNSGQGPCEFDAQMFSAML